MFEEEKGPQELLARPKDYVVKFDFPNPSPLSPPILGLMGKFEIYSKICPSTSIYMYLLYCHIAMRCFLNWLRNENNYTPRNKVVKGIMFLTRQSVHLQFSGLFFLNACRY